VEKREGENICLEKYGANAKIIDSFKTDNEKTVTNQSDILHVQKNYFANLYKNKISGENFWKKK